MLLSALAATPVALQQCINCCVMMLLFCFCPQAQPLALNLVLSWVWLQLSLIVVRGVEEGDCIPLLGTIDSCNRNRKMDSLGLPVINVAHLSIFWRSSTVHWFQVPGIIIIKLVSVLWIILMYSYCVYVRHRTWYSGYWQVGAWCGEERWWSSDNGSWRTVQNYNHWFADKLISHVTGRIMRWVGFFLWYIKEISFQKNPESLLDHCYLFVIQSLPLNVSSSAHIMLFTREVSLNMDASIISVWWIWGKKFDGASVLRSPLYGFVVCHSPVLPCNPITNNSLTATWGNCLALQ